MPNHYETLGVQRDASPDEIKRAYRALSLKWHPDRCPPDKKEEAQSKFQEIGAAYETLSDEGRRQQYNAELDGFHMGGGGMGQGHEVDISEIFNMMFGGAGMPFGMQGMPGMTEMRFGGGPGGPEIHMFHGSGGMHHGMPHAFFQQIHKPPPITKQIELSFEQAYNGGGVCINIEKWVVKNNTKKIESQQININIPPGINNDEVIVICNCGNEMSPELKGDVKLVVKVKPSETFERQGMDLIHKRTISLKESLTGFSFELTHLNGKSLCLNNLTNRTIVKPNYKKIIPNLGMMKDGNVGNLIIQFDVAFPESLTDEQTEKLLEILQ
jgi:DnaJ-class molecular chaperone